MMTVELLLQVLRSREGRLLLGGAGAAFLCIFMFWWGRLTAPEPERAVICAPVLEEVKRLVAESKDCSVRVLGATTACEEREAAACEARHKKQGTVTNKRACEVCDGARKLGLVP